MSFSINEISSDENSIANFLGSKGLRSEYELACEMWSSSQVIHLAGFQSLHLGHNAPPKANS